MYIFISSGPEKRIEGINSEYNNYFAKFYKKNQQKDKGIKQKVETSKSNKAIEVDMVKTLQAIIVFNIETQYNIVCSSLKVTKICN